MRVNKPKHRPKRQFPEAVRKVCQPELKVCLACGGDLKSTGSLYINKTVQTLVEPVNVRAYGYRCEEPECPEPERRYKAVKEVLRISLPKGTYGLDVIAFIGWYRDRQYRQYVEIQQLLQERGVQISERHVGRLYRQYLALLGGLSDQRQAKLKETAQKQGGVIWGLDGLQPDQDGTQLYVLYEIVSETAIAAAWLDKRDTAHIVAWLAPYSRLGVKVLATLSDGEEAEIEALKKLWPQAPHQMCQVHFLGDIGEPIREGDVKLRQEMRASLGGLPAVPIAQPSQPAGGTPPLLSLDREAESDLSLMLTPVTVAEAPLEPASAIVPVREANLMSARELKPLPAQAEMVVNLEPDRDQGRSSILDLPVAASPEADEPLILGPGERSSPLTQAQSRMQELETLFRKAFQEVCRQTSRKPLIFGGLAGYRLLQGLVMALASRLPKGGDSYLHTLLELGQQTLETVTPLAQQVQQAQQMLRQLTHLLKTPLSLEPADRPSLEAHSSSPLTSSTLSGAQVKERFQQKVTAWGDNPRLGAVAQAFLANTQRLLTKWDDDLFHCYDIPALPPNNTALEARFNRLRRSQRRISGRKKTAELRRTAHFQILLQASSPQELWELLTTVPLSAYQDARLRQEVAEERQRWLYRLRRRPLKTATSMVDEYLALRLFVRQNSPDDT
jgi:hypothetical protein